MSKVIQQRYVMYKGLMISEGQAQQLFAMAEANEKKLAVAIEVLEKIAKNNTVDCNIYTMGCDCDDEAKRALAKIGEKE